MSPRPTLTELVDEVRRHAHRTSLTQATVVRALEVLADTPHACLATLAGWLGHDSLAHMSRSWRHHAGVTPGFAALVLQRARRRTPVSISVREAAALIDEEVEIAGRPDAAEVGLARLRGV